MTVSRAAAVGSGREGFVLIAVLWIVGIMAAATLALVLSVQVQIRAAANARQSAVLEATADGLVRQVAFSLADRLSGAEAHLLAASGAAYRCAPAEDIAAVVALQDQAGLIDLNAASLEVLTLALGAAAPASVSAAAAIVDFRDADDDAGKGGAERDDYRKAGRDYGPQNGPFHTTAELDQVLGLEGGPAEALSPFVTVHGFQNGIDPAAAPPHLARLLRDHPALPQTQSPRQFFAIDAIVSGGGGRFHRRAIVAITREPERPYRVVEWLQGSGQLAGIDDGNLVRAAACAPP